MIFRIETVQLCTGKIAMATTEEMTTWQGEESWRRPTAAVWLAECVNSTHHSPRRCQCPSKSCRMDLLYPTMWIKTFLNMYWSTDDWNGDLWSMNSVFISSFRLHLCHGRTWLPFCFTSYPGGQHYVPRYLCSPVPMFPEPMFPGTYVPRYLCSPVPMFPGFLL